jgi:hypothetical protein
MEFHPSGLSLDHFDSIPSPMPTTPSHHSTIRQTSQCPAFVSRCGRFDHLKNWRLVHNATMNGSTFRLLTMPSCRLRVTPSSFFLSRNLRPPTRLKPHLQNKFFTSSRSRATSSEDSLGNALLLDELKAEAQRPISLRPLLVGAGICAVFFFVAEVLDGKHDAKFFATIRRLGWAHDGDLNRLKRLVATAQRNQTLAWLDQADAPIVVKKSYSTVKSWWMKQESGALDGKHATLVLIAANTAVFLAWNLASRYPRLLSRMKKSFSHFPGQTGSYTLLTSVFSHRV